MAKIRFLQENSKNQSMLVMKLTLYWNHSGMFTFPACLYSSLINMKQTKCQVYVHTKLSMKFWENCQLRLDMGKIITKSYLREFSKRIHNFEESFSILLSVQACCGASSELPH